MNDTPAIRPANELVAPAWMLKLASVHPALLLLAAIPVVAGVGHLSPDLGPIMLVGYLGVVGGIVSVLRPGIGLFLFALMLYSRASEVLTTSLGVPSIAPLFTIWLLTGVIMHFGIGGLFNARPSGWQALALYGLVLLASTLVAADPWAATYKVVDYTRELVYIGLIILCVRQLSDLRIVIRAMLVAGVSVACISIYQTLSGSTNAFLGFGRYSQAIVIPGEITEVSRPAGMVGDPNFYALALIALIPLAFHRARWEPSLFARQLSLLAGIVLAVASIMTYSRGGYLTLAFVVGCLVIAGFIKFRSLMVVVLVFLALLPVLPDTYSGRVTSIIDIPRNLLSDEPPERGTATDTSVTGRVSEVMAGVHMFLDHPIMGVGANNYPTHYQEYARPMGVDRRADRSAHSLYVEIAAETGIVGILTFGVLILSLFAALRRVWMTTNRGNELHDLALLVAVSLLSFLVASIFLHMAYPRFLMVFAGLTLAVASVQNWRVAPGSRLRFARLRPTQALLNPAQHRRMVFWGGVAGFVAAALVSALILSMSINPGGLSFAQNGSSAAIRPPMNRLVGVGDDPSSAS
ncbi:MAG TPA: O-antigen ligase family protein, partial [Thermomicrobiales bacterium]|nr:O-antigen ligase family protein [Thermomicrobiales bacterium]